MTLKDLRLLVDKSVNAWVDDYAPSMGAAIAYYTLFSIAPLLILVIAVAGLVFGPEAAEGAIAFQLQGRIGPEAASMVEGLIKSVNHPTQGAIATVLGIFTLMLGASSVFGELQSALNRIWRTPDQTTRSGLFNLVRGRLLSFAMVLILGFLLFLSLVFSALLSAVGEWSNQWFSGWQTALQIGNFLVSFAVNGVIFAMIYKIMPRARIAWRDVWIGATVTALLLEISKFLIGFYLGRSSVASSFGAAGSLVLFLVWVYLSAQIFLLGAEFTWVYSHQRGSRSERYKAKRAPLVPTRAGDTTAEAKAELTMESPPPIPLQPPAPPGFPLIRRYATASGRYLVRKPVVGVSVLAAIGIAAAVLTRRPLVSAARKAKQDAEPPA